MILGLPVVSTDCAGPNELLNYGEFGLLVENNTDKLYEGLKKILSDEQLLEHYKNKAIERSRSFILKERMKEIEKVLEDT
jgi:glycosyltransferase involved in cell wall biosynthesis